MSRAALLWHLLLPVICVVSPLNGRASCDEQWREGLRIVRARSGNLVIDENGHNTSTIPPAILHAALKDHWLDHYKTKLLKDLNMQSAPDPGSRRLPKSIKHQLEMIKAREGQPLEDFEECPPSTVKTEHVRDVIAQAPRPNGNKHRPPQWGIVDSKAKPIKRVVSSTINEPGGRFAEDPKRSYFNLNGMRDSDITNATLYIHVQRPPSMEAEDAVSDELHVHIYKYLNEAQLLLEPEPVIFHKFKGNFSRGIWLSIGLARLAHQWAQNPSKNYGIFVKAEINRVDYINRTVDSANRTSTIILALDVDESPSPSSRLPQAPTEEMTCNVDNQDVKCCRYPLEINFEAFGWDWIIAPKRYNAFYCAGTCPVNYKQMSAHAHLMQQLDFLSSSTTTSRRRSLGPCCTPQDYQDVKVIYIAQDRSIRETLIPGAIVLRCGCA